MFKVLIVDDESWVAESLKDLVDWERYGFAVVGQAYNGSDALAAIKEHGADVVFTDIRMPEMSGLELIQRGRNLALPAPVHFVVVSGYAEFAYAQKAMSYGAVAYCLKPFDEMEISAVLMKLAKQLEAAAPALDSTLIDLLDDPSADNERRLREELERKGFGDWTVTGITAIVAVGPGAVPELRNHAFRLKTGASKTAYLLGTGQAEELASRWRGSFPADVSGIGISDGIAELSGLRGAIAEADYIAHQFFVAGESGVFRPRPFSGEELNRRMVEMSEAVDREDGDAVHRVFGQIGELFREGALSIRHAFQVYNMTISFLFKLGQTETTLYSYEQLIHSFRHVFDMLGALEALAVSQPGSADSAIAETKQRPFNNILSYVTQHYREELSLTSLSEQFYMNPSYISQLFKKEVGETFTAYIARLRIDRARELLDTEELSIQDIAEKVGYRDYFYFARLFKKYTGQTPSQYRGEHA